MSDQYYSTNPLSDRGGLGSPNRRISRPLVHVYAEREDVVDTSFDRWGQRQFGRIKALRSRWRSHGLYRIVRKVHQYDAEMTAATDDDLRAVAWQLRASLSGQTELNRLTPGQAAKAFALVREVAGRCLNMRHYDVQMVGAWAMIRGKVAEMRTGEGKTLCATLAAATAGLMDVPVHIITVNDYLAERDAKEMAPIYHFLGLSVGTVLAGQSPEERRKIYQSDIVFGSNKELAFDYLRDRMEMRQQPGNLCHKVDRISGSSKVGTLTMRGLHFAIVDEGDSVLIDEARTPLIISGEVADSGGLDEKLFRRAMAAADQLREGIEYRIVTDENRVELLDAGFERLEDMAEDDEDEESTFAVAVIREHVVAQALTARFLFHEGIDYVLREGKVEIVDEYTGRIMEDRSWSDGLQQLIELKEELELSAQRKTLSRITYQRYFRRYRHIGAMTGTAQDAAVELWAVYRLMVERIPTNRPDIRRHARDRVFRTEEEKWNAIGKRVELIHKIGAPVLLGTRSVSASEAASARLNQLGISHQVLSATQDANEAEIISRAGERGQVTVATNMAGRGTDIKLGEGTRELGGLHVILSERHDSRRIDRQLEGRCGRQGDPGCVEAYLSLQDELMRGKGAALHRRVAHILSVLGPRTSGRIIRMRQRRIEKLHARMRHDLLEADRQLGDLLAFSGKME